MAEQSRTRRTVLGAGAAGWEAGTDLFLDVARRLADEPAVDWVWVGPRSRGAARRLDNDAAHLDVAGRVRWTEDPADADGAVVLVVTARTTHAARAAVDLLPAVRSIGFHLGSTGTTVPYPDVTALAGAVRAALHDGGDG
jgi:hypothetical protein